MRKSTLKKSLIRAFPDPEPAARRAFVRSLPPAPASHIRFLLGQAGYIRRSAWAASLAVFVLALALGRMAPQDGVWAAAALTPFAAMTAVTEGARSALYGMQELELAARFGLKSVAMARLGAMGLAHLILLAILAPLGSAGLVRTGVYLLTPYLLTALLGMAALRRLRGREAVYAAAAVAVLVAGSALLLHVSLDAYAPARFRWWPPVLLLAAGLTGREYWKTTKRTEELSWN